MKRKIFTKFLSVLIASTLVITVIPNLTYSHYANAAVKPNKIKVVNNKNKKKSRHTLALGEIRSIKSVGKATANVRFSPKNSAIGLRLSSDDTSVVKVKKKNRAGTSWTITGIGAGKANISIRSSVKATLKTNFLVFVTSKTPEELELSKSSLTLNANQIATVEAMNKAADINVTFDSTKVDRFITVASSDNNIVNVTKNNDKKYTLRAIKAGTATITVSSTTDPEIKENLTVTVKSTQPELKFSAKQVKNNQLYVTFSTPLTSSPSISNFRLQQKGVSLWNVALSSCSLSADGKSAYLNTVIDLLKNTTYELTYSPIGATAQSCEFTTSTSKVAKIELKTRAVVANVSKKLSYRLVDNNGIEITDVPDSRVEITVDPKSYGYYDAYSKSLTMFTPGATATVKLLYHTYEYQNGVEQVISSTDTITTLATSNVTMNLDKVIVKKGNSSLSMSQWNAANNNSTLLPAGMNGYYLAARVKSSDGDFYASDDAKNNSAIFSFESKNTDVLNINSTTGEITPSYNANMGKSAVVVITVKFEGKTTSYTININIGASSFPNQVTINPSTLTLEKGKTGTVQIKVLDQYGIDLSNSETIPQIAIRPAASYGVTASVSTPLLSFDSSKKQLIATITADQSSPTGVASFQIVSTSQVDRVLGSFGVFVR